MLFATALTNDSMGDAIDQQRQVMVALANEVLTVAEQRGIRALGFDGFDPAALGSSDPSIIGPSLDQLVAIRRTDEKTHSGVWRDLAVRQRRTEVDAHFLPIVADAAELHLEVPLLERMIAMIHEIEDGQRDFSAANLDELERSATLMKSIR
jgi:2-dehydropantoate 2-reductase